MKRLIISVLAAGVLAITASAGTKDKVATAADQAFVAAVKDDKTAAAAMMRSDLSWVRADGELFDRDKSLGALDAMAANAANETEVQRHFYGRLATVRGSHNGLRFLRIWAETDGQWRLFATIDTPVIPGATASVEAQSGTGDCDNPCRTVPYTPTTAIDKAILAIWQDTKVIEWKPNAAAWSRYIGEEFMIINNTTIRTRAEREVIAKRQEASGVGTPGDPILAMSIHDFGDNAAVMFSKHFPVRGGKPYNNVRVWVLRDGRWQLAISQQSQIASASPLPAVAAK